MAEELGLGVNDKEFEEAQALSREASKATKKRTAPEIVKLDVHDIAALEEDESVPKTDDSAKYSKLHFDDLIILYQHPLLDLGNISANVKAIFYNKTLLRSTSEIPEDATFGLLLDRTSFYAESGGQEYDTGNIVLDGIADFEVTNVQVYNGYILHTGHLKYGKLEVGDNVLSSYDEVKSLYHANDTPSDVRSSIASSVAATE
jgi:alanyl-tRNA synthetase